MANMKFTIAAVVLILAASVSATVVKYHLAPSVRYVSPWVTTRNVVLVNPWESHVALTRGLPYVPIVPYHIPVTHISVPVAHIEPPVITAIPTHGASYVAANRGALHVAPLPGHGESVSSNNLEPADGTS